MLAIGHGKPVQGMPCGIRRQSCPTATSDAGTVSYSAHGIFVQERVSWGLVVDRQPFRNSDAMKWTLYTRRGCMLCERAEDLLAGVPGIECVDVDTCPDLTERYGQRVPVLCDGERVILEGRLTEVAVAAVLGQ